MNYNRKSSSQNQKITKYFAALFSIFLVVGFCTTASAQTKKVSASQKSASSAIRHQFKRWVEAYEHGDAGTMANIYASDAILLLASSKPIKGRAKIHSLLAKSLKRVNVIDYKYQIHALVVNGNWAHRWGIARVTTHKKMDQKRSKTTTTTVKFIDIWKMGPDGTWHIFRDISAVSM